MLSSSEKRDWLRLIRSETIGPALFARLIARFGSARAAIAALEARARPAASADTADAEIEAAEQAGMTMIAICEPGYPRPLAAIESAPPLIYVKGRLELLARDAIAIVGARNASAAGRSLAARFAADLGNAGYLIASGLARGIDGAAHEAALPFGTVAVVAGGCDVIYPPEHRKLHARIGEEGAILAEMPPGTVPGPKHFPRRNRIISGLSRAILVVEAAIGSGSLITARFGLEQGRDIFAVPGSPLDPRAQGCNALIKAGALLASSAADLIEELAPPFASAASPPQGSSIAVTETPIRPRRQIETLLSPTPTAIDEIVRLSGESASTVLAILLDLELDGRLQRHPGHKVSLLAP